MSSIPRLRPPGDAVPTGFYANWLRRFLTGTPIRLEGAKNQPELHGAIVSVDESTGRTTGIRMYEIR